MALNALSGPIPKNLGSLQNLQFLNFGWNFLDSSNGLSFLTSLTNCTNLSFLCLSQNKLTGALPDSIGNLSANLQQFRIDSNYISGPIPKEIQNLLGLEWLGLQENKLTGSIPDSFGKLSKLKYFFASKNRIMGEIPHSLGNMTELLALRISENLLAGEIPASLGNCSYLERLDLSQNRLKATIPKEAIGLCSFSREINFASNRLTGTLPPEIGNCKNLNMLDVSSNKFHGEIPISLENCVMLESLYLQGNSFEGTIPSSFQKLRSMQVLDVSHNNLSGLIPEFLAELPLSTNLNLSSNRFEGKVPTKGVFANISAFSIVGNNELCGGIKPLQLPTCPTEIAKRRKTFPRRAIIVTGIVLFVVLFLICIYAIKRRMSLSKEREGTASPLEKKHLKLSYAELLHATNEFSSANLISKGRYGSVYKGILSFDDQTVAVKVLNLQQRDADRTFKAECEAIRKLRHRNLVKVITSCSSIDFQASALDYLHSQFDKPVVHCNLKPSNILLDADLIAHISDFGLTIFLSETTEESVTGQSSSMGIRGTMGYIPPEYGMGKEISTRGDVYSYGIVLMELFTGKRPTDSIFTGELSLREYVKTTIPDHVAEIVDTWLSFEDEAVFDQNGQSSRGISNVGKCLGSVLSVVKGMKMIETGKYA
ncbi:hypothetical protein GQ457_17G026510 [Hibiscus cannabinus]